MDRRTDRAIAISAITAVVVVPTAILVAVKTGAASPKPAGEVPSAAAAAQGDALKPVGKSPTPTPTASGAGTKPNGGPGHPTPPPGKRGPRKPPPGAPKLKSFVRVTDVKLSGNPNGDYQHLTETAHLTLIPNFALSATGVRQNMVEGKLTTLTQKVIISGRTMRSYDGKRWTSSKLTSSQLSKLRTDSDPRQFTWLIRTVPGIGKTGPDKFGSTHFTAKLVLGDVYGMLPENIAAEGRKVLPDSTGVGIELWSDKIDRPSWIGLNAQAPGTQFGGSMTFRSYR
ncbi:hypothetical protein J4573_29885 [Actinomadura barringtoniae]|uniref:Uncharacterized protein n=1 Tax=Actinomadura barringtoniae TaxID=1427535 RepID=A0A939PFM2_9ACTN|nr:hypothetical protein [Actinomadura barringtoniae]MBO2451337.1 hypothetical protein [Actinomadura barringtoniae]